MKNIVKLISAAAVLVLGLTACEKKLDVIPTQSLSPEAALTTESDLVGVLIGAYDRIQNTSAYGGDMQMMADLWANRFYLRFRGTFAGLLNIASVTTASAPITVDNGWAASLWRQAYAAINSANTVLDSLHLAKGNIRPTASVEGEALFIRGSMYFELVKLYGKTWGDGNNGTNLSVPLILKSTPLDVDKLGPEYYPPRATVQAVYNQAKADLTRASTLLPSTNQHYATKWAAMAQLSRIALMQGDYAAARDYASQVIASGVYTLTTPFNNLWFNYINFGGVAPREYIFYIRITTQDGTNGLNTYFGQTVSSIPGTAGRGDLDAQTAWVNLHEAGDARGTYYQSGSSGRRLTRKHLDRFGHVPVFRLGEMYLTRAEANFRLGTNVGADPVADINRIRERVILPPLTTVTLAQIIKERKLELAYEGQLLWDLKRLRESAAGSNNTNGPAWNSPRLVMPVPQREMDVNKSLVQNEGY
jgi:hypothetical protein